MTSTSTDTNSLLRTALPEADATSMAILRRQLADAAAAHGVLTVAYRITDSPIGRLLVANTDAGLVRVAFELEDHNRVLDELAAKIGPNVLESPNRTDDVARQLDEYFDGRRHRFELDLDFRLAAGFRRTVVAALADIEYGTTASYGAVATAIGNPGAVRAVGTACATNPIPIVLPCHRVVKSDGSRGNYRGGTEAKDTLLDLESASQRLL